MTTGLSGTIVGRRGDAGRADDDLLAFVIRDGVIVSIADPDGVAPGPRVVRLTEGSVLAPGFIDVQVNGGGGVLLNAAPTIAAVETMVAAHRRGGTTGLVPTLITDTPDTLDALIAIAPQIFALPGVLGLHLEGPFINPEKRGVHRADLIRRPTVADINKLVHLATLGRLVVTLAPELVTVAQLRALTAAEVIVSAGHTLATYEEMRVAADDGLRGVTHLFNAMAPLAARAPGVIGAALDDDRLFVGIIADGHHVAASNMRLVLKAKPPGRVMLVTDAMATVGCDLASFDLLGCVITRSGDRLTDANGTLAGAHLTMLDAIRHTMSACGISWDDAVVMASLAPAGFLGLDASFGALVPGRRADLVAIERETFVCRETWVAGHRGRPSG